MNWRSETAWLGIPSWVSVMTLALFAIYFPLALYLKHSYVPADPIYRQYGYHGSHAYVTRRLELDDVADAPNRDSRSPIRVYEDGKLLGPPHAVHLEIMKAGRGRFSHSIGIGIIFSASDNSDPNTNARRYEFVKP